MKKARLLLVTAFFLGFSILPRPEPASEARYRLTLSDNEPKSVRAESSSEPSTVFYRFSPRVGLDYEVLVPEMYEKRIGFILNQLMAMHIQLERTLGTIHAIDITLEVLPQPVFAARTGAPEWVSAMYFRKKILIPVTGSAPPDDEALAATIRHEYTHAALDSLTGGNCPGWLEEGLAQLNEGQQPAALETFFLGWVRKNGPLAISRLEAGFTQLAREEVPVAYGQSLFLTELLLRNSPAGEMRSFLDSLRDGHSVADAFAASYPHSLDDFESLAGAKLDTLLTF